MCAAAGATGPSFGMKNGRLKFLDILETHIGLKGLFTIASLAPDLTCLKFSSPVWGDDPYNHGAGRYEIQDPHADEERALKHVSRCDPTPVVETLPDQCTIASPICSAETCTDFVTPPSGSGEDAAYSS